jgi:hypothetical protein
MSSMSSLGIYWTRVSVMRTYITLTLTCAGGRKKILMLSSWNLSFAFRHVRFSISLRVRFAYSGWWNDMLGSSCMSYDVKNLFIGCCPDTSTPQLIGNLWFNCGAGTSEAYFGDCTSMLSSELIVVGSPLLLCPSESTAC